MLADWQKKYPECFHQLHAVFIELDKEKQDQFSDVLTQLENRGLLNESTINDLLTGINDSLDEIVYLVDIMIKFNCLTHVSLAHVLSSRLSELKECIEAVSVVTPLSVDIFLYLISQGDHEACVKFIAVSIAAKVDIGLVMVFLSHHIKSSGLSRALTLFELSHYDFSHDHLPLFCVLTDVLAIPLCQTIFDARCRVNSDYDSPRDPINSFIADTIIDELVALPDEESKVRTFFNFFAKFRTLPASQKYMIDLDVASLVTTALTNDCEAVIHAIQTRDDFVRAQQMIKNLKVKGGDKAVFDRIKYSVASAIESMDWYSTRSYEQLMEEIWQALSSPQEDLSEFAELFEDTSVYLQVVIEPRRELGFFINPVFERPSDMNTEALAFDKSFA